MNYSEAAFFDGDHCQHVAAYHEWQRSNRIEAQLSRAVHAARRYMIAQERALFGAVA